MINKLDLLHKKAISKGYSLDPPVDLQEETADMAMSEFSSRIAEGQTTIKFLELKNETLIGIKGEVETATGNDQQMAVSNKIQNIIVEIQNRQGSMATLLKELEEIVTLAKEEDKENKNPETRIKLNLFGSMARKYQSVSLRFQTIESEIKTIMQTKIVRNAEIVLGRNLNNEEKGEVLNDPATAQKLLQSKLTGTAHVKLQNAVADLEERHKDIINLEKSIMKVHELIIELAKLVQYQGEMIDNIETNIRTAKDYVHQAEKDIVQSKKNMESARKKKWCILGIAIAILAVILIPVLVTQLK